MKYQKYPAQMIKVAGDLRRAPATFENPGGLLFFQLNFKKTDKMIVQYFNMNAFLFLYPLSYTVPLRNKRPKIYAKYAYAFAHTRI